MGKAVPLAALPRHPARECLGQYQQETLQLLYLRPKGPTEACVESFYVHCGHMLGLMLQMVLHNESRPTIGHV